MMSYLKIFQYQVDHIFGADTTGTESLYTRCIDRQMTMSRSTVAPTEMGLEQEDGLYLEDLYQPLENLLSLGVS